MEDFDLKDLQPYIFLLTGLASVLIALFKKSNKTDLKTTGLKAEGIIYAQDRQSNHHHSITESSNIKDKVTVRFVTKDLQWITGEITQDFAVFFTKQYKVGETVEVYYDPKTPSSFFVDTKQSETMARIVFVILGTVLLATGLYLLVA